MARIKNKLEQTHELTEREFNYIKILNLALNFNTLKDKAISGFLYYVCTSRLGYSETDNLIFEIDLDKDDRILKVSPVPTETISKAIEAAREQAQA